MFEFDPLLAPILVYLVTAGVKSLFGSISGKGSMLVAAAVGALLVFGESVIGGLGQGAADTATAIVQVLLVIASGFGLHDVVKQEIGKR
jgi:hypothetical protein